MKNAAKPVEKRMDNKVTKQRINNHLEYDWYLYLLILIVAIVGSYFLFSQINRTRDYEDVTVFVSCYLENDHNFSGQVLSDMDSSRYHTEWKNRYGDAVLRDVAVEAQDPLGSEYMTLLQTHGMVTSDILIVGKSVLDASPNAFVELTDELLTEYLLPEREVINPETGEKTLVKMNIDDFEYYSFERQDGTKRRNGIKVSGFAEMHGAGAVFQTDWREVPSYYQKYGELKEEEQPDDEFYLVLNTQSVNIGKFGKKAKNKNTQALFVANRFLSYYRV